MSTLKQAPGPRTCTQTNDGGPAFPVADPNWLEPSTVEDMRRLATGMSMRDHFAGLAMQAFISGHITYHGHEEPWLDEEVAVAAYEMADAMLKARSA